jgi:hypothetical protein
MSQSNAPIPLDSLMHVIRAEYREMPDMRLTVPQFRRLWHLDSDVCEQVTAHLVAEGFLGKDQASHLYLNARARPRSALGCHASVGAPPSLGVTPAQRARTGRSHQCWQRRHSQGQGRDRAARTGVAGSAGRGHTSAHPRCTACWLSCWFERKGPPPAPDNGRTRRPRGARPARVCPALRTDVLPPERSRVPRVPSSAAWRRDSSR